jgi:hypothetical protein
LHAFAGDNEYLLKTSGVGADRRTLARSEATRIRGGGSSTPGEAIALAGFRNRN